MKTKNLTLAPVCDETLTAVVGGASMADDEPGCGGFCNGDPYEPPTDPPTTPTLDPYA